MKMILVPAGKKLIATAGTSLHRQTGTEAK